MSLNEGERERTRGELRANLERSGLGVEDVAADLGVSTQRVEHMLAVTASPSDVWLLRDYLEHAVRDSGADPVPFTVLTEGSRAMAGMWFELREAPRHRFAG